jgi:hypothetical protein
MKGTQIMLKPLMLGVVLAAGLASPALAAPEPRTRLVSCDEGSCLFIRGRRADAASPVSINGHTVAVEGARRWHASLPVETVRAWSAPYARTITVSVADAATPTEADLPIGLLGHAENLAMLVISVK